jgi:Holliday junction resolvase-like predicted endonuclease
MFGLFRKRHDAQDGNVGVIRGRWGEDIASEWLRAQGYCIVDRNVRPCVRDRRLEIDIVAYDREQDVIAFVEVKQHARRAALQRRIRSVDRRKLSILRRACRAWLRRNRWGGGYRFDVIEVYGAPDSRARPEIDHVKRVRLFTDRERFVNWEC